VECLVQLERAPLPAERGELARQGVELREYVGGNGYFARVAPKTRLEDVGLVRWAGPVLPKDKISPPLWKRHLAPGATAPSGLMAVVVSFAEDTPENEARRILETHARDVRRREPSLTWTGQIEPAEIPKLAEEAGVRWVEEAPPPGFAPLSP
jgi:hypothetical protein